MPGPAGIWQLTVVTTVKGGDITISTTYPSMVVIEETDHARPRSARNPKAYTQSCGFTVQTELIHVGAVAVPLSTTITLQTSYLTVDLAMG